jgi:hypothetical protein
MFKCCSLFLVFTILTLTSSLAAPKRLVGSVIKLRGKVTQLAPGQHIARALKVGQKVKEDTSIVTAERSFAKIQFDDGSMIFIGPKSKVVVVKMDPSGNGVVGLLKGKMRSKVESREKKKFYIRTRNAALGVRGTEFETVYNPDNKITSLVTYKGEVAMAKVSPLNKKGLLTKKKVQRAYNNEVIVEESESVSKSTEDQLEALLKTKETVKVKGGQLSQTVQKFGVVSQPIKISPVQVNALYVNEEYKQGDRNSKKLNLKLSDEQSAKLKVRSVEQEVAAEGIVDIQNKVFAAKSGGLFDLESGLYVPPGKDALFDQKNKIYVAQNIGSVDSATGSYVAPLGLELDPVVGFKEKGFKKNAPTELIARVQGQKKRLNGNLAKDLMIAPREEVSKVSFSPLSAGELISKNVVQISASSFDQDIDQRRDSFLGGDRSYRVKDASLFKLSLDYASGSKWQPTSYFSMKKVSIPGDQRGSSSQSGDSLVVLGVGMRYSVTSRWGLLAGISLDQDYFLHHSSTTSGTTSSFIRVTTPKLDLGIRGTLIRSGRFTLETGFVFGTNLAKETGDHKLRAGYHYDFNFSGRYWLAQQYFLQLGLNYSYLSNDTEGSTQVYTSTVTRKNSGALLSLGTYF